MGRIAEASQSESEALAVGEPSSAVVPAEVIPHVRQLITLAGPAAQKHLSLILTRISGYLNGGYTPADIALAVSSFFDPEQQAKLEYPDSLLQVFAAAVVEARRRRRHREDAERVRLDAIAEQKWRADRERAIARLTAGHPPETEQEKAVALLHELAVSYSMTGR